jgi:hypothetical protein
MSDRSRALSAIGRALGRRRLIWSGLRGSDARSLSDLPQFETCFSIFDALDSVLVGESLALESISGVRPDAETWDIDHHPREEAVTAYRRAHLRVMSAESVFVPYRESSFCSDLGFARSGISQHLGQFVGFQRAFEHKPWVEVSLRERGLDVIDWRYVADEDQLDAVRLVNQGRVVLRPSQTTGGEGFATAVSAAEIQASWPRRAEQFSSVAPYIDHAIPLNVGAVVWPDGGVTVHHASVQLIGISSCVGRVFGHCGNDFAAAQDLPQSVLADVEAATRAIGEWLASRSYVGAYGVDFLLKDGVPLFTEVNPRFQGSTAGSCRLSVEADLPCLLLDHVAAHLGAPRVERPGLWEQVRSARPLAQVAVHWTGGQPRRGGATSLCEAVQAVIPASFDAVLPPGVTAQPGATVVRLDIRGQLTETGQRIQPQVEEAIAMWQHTTTNEGSGSCRTGSG